MHVQGGRQRSPLGGESSLTSPSSNTVMCYAVAPSLPLLFPLVAHELPTGSRAGGEAASRADGEFEEVLREGEHEEGDGSKGGSGVDCCSYPD